MHTKHCALYYPRYVESTPKWAKQLEGEMSLGKHVLEFKARSPVTNQTAACQMIIHVKDTEPPRVSTCPHSFLDYLGQDIFIFML
jgi:fibulin 1/2